MAAGPWDVAKIFVERMTSPKIVWTIVAALAIWFGIASLDRVEALVVNIIQAIRG